MTRRPEQFSTIRTEGALLPADLLARVAAGDKTLDGIGPEAYHLAPGERLNEAINRSWNRLVGAWAAFTETLDKMTPDDRTATNITRTKWSLILFQELGYGQLQVARGVEVDGKPYPISHAWGAVPIHLPGARVEIDRRTAGVAGAASMSPHGLVQEFLNRSDDHLWGFLTNGLQLRLLRDNVSLTRPAYVEFDLQKMFIGQVYADFVVLWLVCHQSRVEAEMPEKCLVEQWMAEASERGTRALDQLRVGVETAITQLGQGFLRHRDNRDLREKLRSGDLDKRDYQRQLLRLVYRLIFLFVAESRELLLRPDADATTVERYRRFYSLSRLRSLAEARRGTAHADLWQALQVVFRGLGADNGEPALGLPALGSFLWSDRAIVDLDVAALDNRHVLGAVRALSAVRDGAVTRSVDYRNLGAEELGSIYESLLELHPALDVTTGAFALTTAAGNERKTTGSYYTPTSLINELLDSALEPVLAEAAATGTEAAILALTVLDPACGSGHFLIAAAHRIARRLAAIRTGDEEPSPADTRTALRDVIGRCIYGVDVNPMATELCKVSLWMEAVEPGKPLSFLEHRIVCGNSLLGATPALLAAGVPDEAFKPLEGDAKTVVASLRKRNHQEAKGQTLLDFGGPDRLQTPLAAAMAALDAIPDADFAGVRAKERRFVELVASADAAHARLVADAWCAAFVIPKQPGAPVLTEGVLRRLRRGQSVEPSLLGAVAEEAERYRFLHPHLAFPGVFRVPAEGEKPTNAQTGWSGGFSVVLGNPPWERVKLSEKEFFAERAPEVAAAAGAKRKAIIAALVDEDPALFDAYRLALRQADGESSLLRSSGRYPLCGRGDVNTFAVFAENMRTAIGPTGRCGVIVPSGIATDDTTKHFFADIVERGSLVSLFDFENAAPIFAGVHRSFKFCLLTLSGADRPATRGADFVFFAHTIADLADPERRFTLSADDLALLNPNTRTCPVFRSRRDAELTEAIYRRVPVLIDDGPPERNPWGIRFSTIFHMTNDSGLFRSATELEATGARLEANIYRGPGAAVWLPLYEGRLGHQFNHRYATQPAGVLSEVPDADLRSPSVLVEPGSWVPAEATEERLARRQPRSKSVLLGFRRVARNTDERTVIATLLPWGAASYGWILSLGPDSTSLVTLAGAYNSFAFDYLLRGNLTQPSIPQGTMEQVPAPPPTVFAEAAAWSGRQSVGHWLTPRVLELTYTAWDLSSFAADLGCHGPPFQWDDERRLLVRAEIDAAFFHLYGIERDDADYIMGTFPIVRRKDEKVHGEYRTKRLILECYDAMERSVATGRPYETVLDPPPADPRLTHAKTTRPAWASGGAQ